MSSDSDLEVQHVFQQPPVNVFFVNKCILNTLRNSRNRNSVVHMEKSLLSWVSFKRFKDPGKSHHEIEDEEILTWYWVVRNTWKSKCGGGVTKALEKIAT